MKNFVHFIYTPFTGLGLYGGYRGNDWFAYRIEIFKNYTVKSLLNQTNRNFVHWISFRPQERTNPLTIALFNYMKSLKDYPFIFTFGGLCYWDDKFENDNLLERLRITLPVLKEICEGREYAYKTILASDDMSHKEAIENVQRQEPKEGKALIRSWGYLLNEQTHRLAEWNPGTNPPFYTIMYPMDVFLDPEKHYKYMKGFRSHEDIPKLFNCTELSGRRYCVLVHKKNISTNWHHPFRGRIFSSKEGIEILKDFGIKVEPFSEIEGRAKEVKLRIKHWLFQLLIKADIYKYAWGLRQTFRRKRNRLYD